MQQKQESRKFFIYFFILIGFLISIGYSPPLTSCGVIVAPDIYTLTQDINSSSGVCINITVPDVTIDCNNFMIRGNNNYGSIAIYSNQPNTKIYNCVISNFSSGIQIVGDPADFANITNNTINLTYSTSCSNANGVCNAIFLNNADNSTITNNRLSSSRFIINLLYYSTNNLISNNVVSASVDYGIILTPNSNNNIIQYNNISVSSTAIYLEYSSNNNIIQYNNISANSIGIALTYSSSYNTILYNDISVNYLGLYLGAGLNNYNNFTINTLRSNSTNSSDGTIYIDYNSSFNRFVNNTINQTATSANAERPIKIINGSHNVFINNRIISFSSSSTPAIEISSANTNNTFY
ncbi:MAG: right-handed parallel beta-helix repeat-containing protein, partial [Candidatus Micrarchaeota archaeon]|nr:right-handed parallel beta-helix repeat-containing protein [Candidatus Micrarchaeota archaeon]